MTTNVSASDQRRSDGGAAAERSPERSKWSPPQSAVPPMRNAASMQKALSAEKRLIEAQAKYMLAKHESNKAWREYMDEETVPAIKYLYRDACELDEIWVKLQYKYSLQLPEQRRLFKQLAQGEQELEKIWKRANTASKTGRQLDESLLKRKGAILRKKIDLLRGVLRKADNEEKITQKQYAMAEENHHKYKHNQIRKLTRELAEAEAELYHDCFKISEVKAQICQMYLDKPYGTINEANVSDVSSESRAVLKAIYATLNDAAVGVGVGLSRTRPEQPRTNTAELAEDDFDLEACYRAIPDQDSDSEQYSTDYIYEPTGRDSNSEGGDVAGVYENVDAAPTAEKERSDRENKPSQKPAYLDLIDDSGNDERESPSSTVADDYEDHESPPLKGSGANASCSGFDKEEIFGSCSSLGLRPSDRRTEGLESCKKTGDESSGRRRVSGKRYRNVGHSTHRTQTSESRKKTEISKKDAGNENHVKNLTALFEAKHRPLSPLQTK